MSNSKDLNSLECEEPITMIKGNRLSDLSLDERQQFFNFLDQHKKDQDLLQKIRDTFGLEYNRTSMRYIKCMANRKDEAKHIQEDSKVMEKWKVPENKAKEPNYADFLDELANNRLTNEEFTEITHAKGF